MADTTMRDQVQRTKVHLYGAQRLELRELTADLDEHDNVVHLDDVAGITRGTLLGFGLELWYVLQVGTGSPADVRVVRGFLRSVATTHITGELGEVNPRFPAPLIVGALADEVASWGEELYNVHTVTASVGPGESAVNLKGAEGCYGLIDCRWCTADVWAIETWRPIPRASYARLVRTDDCATPALLLGQIPGADVRVRATVAMPFHVEPWTPATDMLTDVGLGRSMLDLPSMGAALRLWATQEIPRSDRIGQPEPRRAADVPPGAVSQMLGPLANLIRQRKKEESGKLLARYPIRIQ